MHELVDKRAEPVSIPAQLRRGSQYGGRMVHRARILRLHGRLAVTDTSSLLIRRPQVRVLPGASQQQQETAGNRWKCRQGRQHRRTMVAAPFPTVSDARRRIRGPFVAHRGRCGLVVEGL